MFGELFYRQTWIQIHGDLEDSWDSTRNLVLGGFLRIQEDSGFFMKSPRILEDSRGLVIILENSG